MEPRARTSPLVLALLGVAVVGLVAHALFYPFVTDDAYISFRYSHNLAYHGELTFNLGDRVEGYTNFLWTALLGVLLKLGLRPEVMSRVLGAAFGAIGLLLVYVIARLYRGGRPSPWEALAPLLLAASASFAVWCSGGLETQLFAALVLGGVALYLAEEARRVRRRWSGLLFALAAMTRPEGLFLFALTGLHRVGANLASERRLLPRLGEVLWVLGFLVPYGAYFLWRYRYYGYPFPNTYYIKAGGGATASAVKWGLPYLWDFLRDSKLYALAPLLLGFWPRTSWRRGEAAGPAASSRSAPQGREAQGPRVVRPAFLWSYLALLVLPFTAYLVLVGGDFMAMGRFFVPVLPLLLLLGAEAARETCERPRRAARADAAAEGGLRAPDAWRASRFVPVAALLVGLAVWNSVLLKRESERPAYRRWGLDTVSYLDRFAADRILVGRWMRKHLPPDTYLAVGGAGAIVYASRLKALDTFGLNDRFIAHRTPPVGDRPGHMKTAPDDYLMREKPDLMCHQAHHQDVPYQPPPFEELHWRARGYRWVCLDPPGLRPAYYCCLKRLDRALGPWPAEVGS